MARDTLRQLAYRAIERDTLSEDKATAADADEAMSAFLSNTMPKATVKSWAEREKEYRQLQRA